MDFKKADIDQNASKTNVTLNGEETLIKAIHGQFAHIRNAAELAMIGSNVDNDYFQPEHMKHARNYIEMIEKWTVEVKELFWAFELIQQYKPHELDN